MTATLIDSDAVGFADGNAGHVYNFPAGAPSVGELDILCLNSNTVIATPSGFALRVDATNAQGAYIFSRKATGGEASSVTITTTGDENTTLTWSRWSGTDAFSDGDFVQANNSNDTVLPATLTGALATTGMLVVAFGALHNHDGALATSPIWINSWTPLEAVSQGTAGTSSSCVAFTAYKDNAGTAQETISSVSWTNVTRNRYALWVAFTSDAAGDQTIEPGGIATAEAFGTATLQATNTISPTGIASAEAFGTATVSAANTISPTGIASAEAFGTATLSASNEILPTGIPSAEAFGTATLIPGAVTISPTGIPSAEAFGTALVTHGSIPQVIMPEGIPSKEAFGIPTIFHRLEHDCECPLLVGD